MENVPTTRESKKNVAVLCTLLWLIAYSVGITFVCLLPIAEPAGLLMVWVLFGGGAALWHIYRLVPFLHCDKLPARAKLSIANSWLLLPVLPWGCYVAAALLLCPDAQNGIALLFGGLFAMAWWIATPALTHLCHFFYQNWKATAPEK